ncbi:MAG: DUF937 domain-containing protein, partial [Cyanobacteria bacterium P01_D01_bin.44]
MSLFFEVLSSINNPEQTGSISDLENITQSIQQVSTQYGVQPNQMQSLMGSLGPALGPALKQQGNIGNLASLLGKATGGDGAASLQSLLPAQAQQQIAQTVAQQAGLNAGTVQGMLPTLLPAVMGLLNMGSSK